MAQLGDLSRAKTLLRHAARAFGPGEAVARARCAVAEAEIALVSRDLNWPVNALDTAHDALARHGDHANAAHARYLQARYPLLIGRLGIRQFWISPEGPGSSDEFRRRPHFGAWSILANV